MLQPQILLDGLAYVESPRWRHNRLWFSHWGTGEIVAVDLQGNSEVMARVPMKLGYSFDWLPDGRLLVTGQNELMRVEPDGSLKRHADLSGVANHGWNEIVVDGRGNIYLNGADFDFLAGAAPQPGIIVLIRPDGSACHVADGIAFPNGMLITPDNATLIIAESFAGRLTAFEIAADGSLSNRRTWTEGIAPDGICMDAEGAIWSHAADTRSHTGRQEDPEGACIRVREGGEILERIEFDRSGFACMLGGPGRRTLFMLAAEWRGIEKIDEAIAARTGQVLIAPAPAPGVGWP